MNHKPSFCPCGTQKTYEECCGRFHKGELPKTALELMRSRYAAYALNLPDYIIKTTHPKNSQWQKDHKIWAKSISEFSKQTQFQRLEILHFEEMGDFATVTFTVHLLQNQSNATFTEKSQFERVKNQWLYLSGTYSTLHR